MQSSLFMDQRGNHGMAPFDNRVTARHTCTAFLKFVSSWRLTTDRRRPTTRRSSDVRRRWSQPATNFNRDVLDVLVVWTTVWLQTRTADDPTNNHSATIVANPAGRLA